ncbi:hypothetical protein AB0K60_24325 [Thermopolyspora sp. NPDC052614]|uniref:hypothetical protein n=1 Tax=Thermopolyspora sp. NPDC052614 TaxID=3155682 RepID=UPI00342EDD4C
MLVLGIVLILLAIAAAIAVTVNEPTASTTITVFGRDFGITATQMFVLGVITAALFLIGLALLMKGLRRARRRRKELRYVRHDARDRVARLEEEKRELQRRLERSSPADTAPTGRAVPAEGGAPAGSREAGYAGGDTRENVPADQERTATTQPRSFIDRLVAGGRREGTPRR